MVIYDKLKNMKTEEKTFDFKCNNCGANGLSKNTFDIQPIGISWKPDYVDNSDIKSVSMRKYLDELPTLREAIKSVMNDQLNYTKLSIICNACKSVVSNYEKIDPSHIKKWLNKNTPDYIDLRQK